ncbi:hypothetical protein BDQ17DRAFT_826594 [Cyathus striatus]|nr:hypothetical protein BDQ17DRAFT_826594 [Cyathus striatus]
MEDLSSFDVSARGIQSTIQRLTVPGDPRRNRAKFRGVYRMMKGVVGMFWMHRMVLFLVCRKGSTSRRQGVSSMLYRSVLSRLMREIETMGRGGAENWISKSISASTIEVRGRTWSPPQPLSTPTPRQSATVGV